MNVVNYRFEFPLLKKLLLLSVLLGMGSGVIGQTFKGQTNQSDAASFSMDLRYGDIKFTDAEVTYYNSSGVLQTHNRTSGETYEITQSNSGTPTNHTISFGTQVTYNSNDWEAGCETGGTLVSVETVVYLAGINIELTDDADKNKAPIMVNNSASAVYLILKNGTTNTIKMECAGINHHAGIEKELWSPYNNASGHLVITCESGYANHDHSAHTGGHDCTEGGSCGILNVYGNKAYSEGFNNGDGGRYEAQGAAAIGGIAGAILRSGEGLTSGHYDVATHTGTPYRLMKNLVIAGGVIMAKAGAGYGPSQSGAAGIGLGAGPLASVTGTGPGIENLCITGGRITAKGSSGSASNIGGSYRSNNVSINISGGYIDATERWRDGEDNNYGKGAGIGSGAGGTESGSVGRATINISGGTVYAKSHWGAAIGGASGGSGTNENYSYTSSSGATINITGGYVNAETTSTGAALGSGGLFAYSDWTGITGDASVTISGGTVIAKSAAGADIGTGGQINFRDYTHAGDATVNITGNNTFSVTANTGGIGGGKANGGNGGSATITINAPNATINASSIGGGESVTGVGGDASVIVIAGNPLVAGTIGGGNSLVGDGGTATVNVQGGTLAAFTIGGGNSTSDGTILVDTLDPSAGYQPMTTRNGGNANVIVGGGTLNITEKIGGGKSYGTGNGGNASIYVTGGILDCQSIGGGDSNLGAPGSVAAEVQDNPALPNYNPLGAGIYIAGNNKITVKSGYIGGGINTAGDIGKSTAYVNATHNESTIQGQFILCNNTSTTTDHSFFIMEAGTLDNTNLGAVGATSYPRKKAEGGAVYMEDLNGVVSISGGTVRNSTGTLGGAVYMTHGAFTLSGTGKMQSCTASDMGGAVYLGGGSVTINGGIIGGELVGTDTIGSNIATNYGSGAYLAGGTFTMNGGSIQYNKGANRGSGFAVVGGTVTVTGGNIVHNQARQYGGGIYVDPGTGYTTTINNTTSTPLIAYNTAAAGGAVYANSGDVHITGATISNNTSTDGNGGAFMIANGGLTVSNSNITNNSAPSGNGGGAYVGGTSNIVFNAGTKITSNTAINGGGICVEGGSIQYNNGEIKNNTATGNGGGIYASANVSFSGGEVSNNTATNGGGLYTESGTVGFTSGTFENNSASQYGGGIYLKEGATLNMTGNATLSHNHVPADGEGGGVYLDGTLNVGDGTTGHTLKIEDNYAGTTAELNNVFLPHDDDVITLLSDISAKDSYGNYLTHIGFSVNRGFRKVVYAETAHEPWLAALMGSSSTLVSAIFDDAAKYIAVHLTDDRAPFENEYIYLWGCWTTAVTSNPGEAHIELVGDTYHIKSNQGLAWFTSLVNGLNHRDGDATSNPYATAQPNLKAVVEADVNMEDYLWVPIGGVGQYQGFDPSNMSSIFTPGGEYTGVFDGQGHIISGLDCRYITSIQAYGLFGNMTGGEVRNTFVKGYSFFSEDNSINYNIGGIAGHMTAGTLSNCEAQGEVTASTCGDNTAVGGLVGLAEATANIHSSIAQPFISQGKASIAMGGLVGKLVGTDASLKNSYSNPRIGSSVAGAVGGLVGNNSGTVENCYVRLQGTTEPTYWFAATNTGSIQYCYAPEGETNYAPTGGTLDKRGNYSPTALASGKYGYAQQDQQVTATNAYVQNGPYSKAKGLAGLLLTLNNWVDDNDDDDYATWTRTLASSINDDYPVHVFDDFSNVASRDGVYVEYLGDVNAMVDRLNAYSGGGDIYLYKPDTLRSNTNNNVRIHIPEDLGVVAESEAVVTNARVGVTLDNSDGGDLGGAPYDWHMFSTSLSDAPLGITYNDMSTHQYGYVIPASAITLNAGGYFPTNTPFGSFDYYCYSEPFYHWINFKRSSNDHWHQDEPHGQINYNDINNQGTAGNEATLIPGKGYLVAIDKETMVLADGRLANGDVTYKTTSSDLYGYEAPLKGVNLIGNPYQSYLNFDEFVNGNADKVYGNTYYILDADSSKYLAYTAGSTDNGIGAPGYLHPHQGFFVRVESNQPLTFTNAMRLVAVPVGEDAHFRDERPAYPLVNMICTDATGMMDYTTIELNRPEQGGGQKIEGLRTGNASLWFHIDGEDWQTAFTQEGLQEAPLRFDAHVDGTYTMRWSTLNGDFSYLHLIDNVTGTDTDCLLSEEYRFTATTHDYLSRFTLVFACTGVDEDIEPSNTASFAFMMGDELVVNGEGVLQVYDMNGRLLTERELHGTQSTLSLPNVAQGMYLLRLRSDNQVRVQKMVINK